MKYLFLSVFLLNFSFSFGQTDWLFLQGEDEDDVGSGIVIDSKDYIYVVGLFEGEVDFDPGPGVDLHVSAPGNRTNAFIQKFAPDQTLIWVKTFGDGGGLKTIRDVVIDSDDNIYIAGEFVWSPDFKTGPLSYNLASQNSADGFVAKYDDQGELIWAKGVEGYGIQGVTDLEIDSDNDLYFTGYFRNDVDLDPDTSTAIVNVLPSIIYQGFNGFVGKWNSDGQYLWGGSYRCENCRAEEVVVNSNGEIFILGVLQGDLDADITPSASVITRARNSVFIAKMDSLTNLLWVKAMDGVNNGNDTYSTYPFTATLDDSSNLYIGGVFSGNAFLAYGDPTYNVFSNGVHSDAFVQKLNSSGDHLWTKVFGNIYSDYVSDITTSSDGQLFLTGSFADSVMFNDSDPSSLIVSQSSDLFAMSWNQDGSFNWVETFGGVCDRSAGSAIVYDNSYNLYGTGYYNGTIETEAGQTIYGNGDDDCIVYKIGGHLGVPEKENDDTFKVYPNPAKNWITLESTQNTIVTIHSLEGRFITSFEVEGKFMIDLQGFKSGVYNLEYSTNRRKGNVRIVIN